jgi:hypothetical protein
MPTPSAKVDAYLLFTDGFHNGADKDVLNYFDAPYYIFSSSDAANHNLLRVRCATSCVLKMPPTAHPSFALLDLGAQERR